MIYVIIALKSIYKVQSSPFINTYCCPQKYIMAWLQSYIEKDGCAGLVSFVSKVPFKTVI